MKCSEKIALNKNLDEKFAILTAMSELLQETSLDALKISSICELSGVSKTTFYRLFSNKYEVVRWLLRVYSSEGLDQIGRTLTWREGLHYSISNLHKHHTFISAANRTKHALEAPQEVTCKHRQEILLETIEQYKKVEVTEKLAFQVEAWACLSTQIAAKWYREEFPYSPQQYADYLESVVPSELYLLLNKPANPRPLNPFDTESTILGETSNLALTMLNTIGGTSVHDNETPPF